MCFAFVLFFFFQLFYPSTFLHHFAMFSIHHLEFTHDWICIRQVQDKNHHGFHHWRRDFSGQLRWVLSTSSPCWEWWWTWSVTFWMKLSQEIGGDIQWKHVGKVEKQTKNLVNSHSVSNSVIFSLFQLHLSILCSGQICYQQFWCAWYNCIPSQKRRASGPGFADSIQQRSGTRALAHSGLGGQNASADRWIASWIGWKQRGLRKRGPGFSSEISDSWSWCIWRSYLCEHHDGRCVVNWDDDGISRICKGLCTCVYTQVYTHNAFPVESSNFLLSCWIGRAYYIADH